MDHFNGLGFAENGLGFSIGGGTKKPKPKKKKDDVVLRPQPKSEFALPKWTPYVVGAFGLTAVILILLKSKGKD